MVRKLGRLVVALGLLVGLAQAAVTSTTSRQSYTGDGFTTAFAYTFPVQAAAHVEVYVAGVKQTSGVTVAMNANQATSPGGTVTFTTAPTATSEVRLERRVPLTQPTVWAPYSAFQAKALEKALDRQVMLLQQFVRDDPTAGAIDAAAQASSSAGVAASAASSASASAAAAGGASSAASASVTAAESARDAALAAGKIYVDTTAGLAATAEGDYFSVPSAVASETFILYRKESSVAVEKKRYLAKIDLTTTAGKNKFNSATVTDGYELNSSGVLVAMANSTVSAPIAVVGKKWISVSGLPANPSFARYWAFYGSDGTTFISGGNWAAGVNSGTIAIPTNAYFFRFCPRQRQAGTPDFSMVQAELTWAQTAYEAYTPRVLTFNAQPLNQTPSDLVAATFRGGKNLFTPEGLTGGYEINNAGAVVAMANSSVSDFIDVEGRSHLAISGLEATSFTRYYVFLAADKTTVTGTGNIGTATSAVVGVPVGSYWFRFCPRQRTVAEPTYATAQVEYGEAATAFEAYTPRVASLLGASVDRYQPPRAGAGLRYLFFGDSITATATITDAGVYTEGTRANWPSPFSRMVNAASLYNYAVSGATYKGSSGLWTEVSYQITKAAEHGRSADVVILAAGTNDGVTSLGDFTTAMGKASLAALDRTLYYEALRWAFWQVRLSWPTAHVFVVLPIQRTSVTPESQAANFSAIRAMANRYGVIVIDGTYESGIVSALEPLDLSDGLHPNAAGQLKMAKLIAARVRSALGW